jgi:2,5-diamino-6-(ribosylamino)-4(3H)-pyrimidinone 5'-phosphate reductase
VIVSSTASLDGRITFSRREHLLTPQVGHRWESHWPPDVPDLIAQRAAKWFVVVDGPRARALVLHGRRRRQTSCPRLRAHSPAYLAWLGSLEVPYLLAGEGRVDLPLALRKIERLLAAGCVVSEGAAESTAPCSAPVSLMSCR